MKQKKPIYKKNWCNFIICKTEYLTAEMKQLLLDPDKFITEKGVLLSDKDVNTVVKINLKNCSLVIKRFNGKNGWDRFKRFFRRSRAIICWRNAKLLNSLGLATPQSIAIIEKRFGPLRGISYFITAYCLGLRAKDYFVTEQNNANLELFAQKLISSLLVLRNNNIRHGDLNVTNFIIGREKIYLVDLESLTKYSALRYKLNKTFQKNMRRFLRDWQESPVISKLFIDTHNRLLKNEL